MIRLVYLDTGHNRSKRNHLLAVVSTNSIRHILIIAHLLPCLVHTRSLTVYMCVYMYTYISVSRNDRIFSELNNASNLLQFSLNDEYLQNSSIVRTCLYTDALRGIIACDK